MPTITRWARRAWPFSRRTSRTRPLRVTRSARAARGSIPAAAVSSRSSSSRPSLTEDRSVNCSSPAGAHLGGVGVDGLALREVDEGRERLRGLEDLEAQVLLAGLQRRRHSRDPGPDDDEVERPALGRPSLERRVGDDRLHCAGPAVRGELEERNAGQVADDVQPRDAGRAVGPHVGHLLDRACRPLRVQPVHVPRERVCRAHDRHLVDGRDLCHLAPSAPDQQAGFPSESNNQSFQEASSRDGRRRISPWG